MVALVLGSVCLFNFVARIVLSLLITFLLYLHFWKPSSMAHLHKKSISKSKSKGVVVQGGMVDKQIVDIFMNENRFSSYFQFI